MTDTLPTDNLNIIDNNAPQKLFGTAFLGFKREEVLDYIERITASSNAEIQKNIALFDTAQCELKTYKEDNATLLIKIKEASEALENEKSHAVTAECNLAELRIEFDKKCDESDSFKSRLFTREQENVVLKADNTRLNTTINSLTVTVNEYNSRKDELMRNEQEARSKADSILQEVNGIALTTKRDAQKEAQIERDALLAEARTAKEKADEEAQRILDKAGDEAVEMLAAAQREKNTTKLLLNGSCEDISESVAILKRELAEVDTKIAEAAKQLQNATAGIATALDNTEKNLDILGIQVKKFPENATAARLSREDVYTQAAHKEMHRLPTHKRTIADSILDGLNRILG
ncbi:MAG: hypothetical protein RR654_07650 [Oscillospiraceae bacterium]